MMHWQIQFVIGDTLVEMPPKVSLGSEEANCWVAKSTCMLCRVFVAYLFKDAKQNVGNVNCCSTVAACQD